MSNENPVNVAALSPHEIFVAKMDAQKENKRFAEDLMHIVDVCDRLKKTAVYCQIMLKEAQEKGVPLSPDAAYSLKMFSHGADYENAIGMALNELYHAGQQLSKQGITPPQGFNRSIFDEKIQEEQG